MTNKTPVFLKDYQPPTFYIDEVHLEVSIETAATEVAATLHCRRHPNAAKDAPLVLDGEALKTLGVSIDEKALGANEYSLDENRLTIHAVPDQFLLGTKVLISPETNTELSGFYKSQNGYFTQCEPQGFRRITWFIDRPDVMARYTVTLHADKATFPDLLANGNPIAQGDEANGRHFARWQDPFPKPGYLFAMVAAKLEALRETYTTRSGRTVKLAVYVEPGKLDQTAHAMAALKKAMRWDEENFSLECDLDHYMIVAVGDFNMGAMENKGLNIFNTKYVLARPDVATDTDFENIDRVVAHEYFHNWTGNRVTCRDWFQLSLKEGLTVFRDQEFGADTHGRSVGRIRDVRALRAAQFPEDAGPMAHPVRPASYLEINNFYTMTVYEKGAEVVRMLHTLIGKAAFRRGMEIYFERHDGQAVTCDEFVSAMAAAHLEETKGKTLIDFSQFMRWYSQSGTPRVSVAESYDALSQQYTLTLTQISPPSPGLLASEREPLLIPFAVGLLDENGEAITLGENKTTQILHLKEREDTFVFKNIKSRPVVSLLRNFSAPVILNHDCSEDDLCLLFAHDTDAFNRWEAGQRLFSQQVLENAGRFSKGQRLSWSARMTEAAKNVLISDSDPAFIAEALTLPSEATLAEQMDEVDPEALYQARSGLAQYLACALEKEFAARASSCNKNAYSLEKQAVATRRLRNVCLSYLNELEKETYRQQAFTQFKEANNMTDQFAALSILTNTTGAEGKEAKEALVLFYDKWKNEALVVDKWLSVQAACRLPGTLAGVQRLVGHEAFDLSNPNKVYALLRTFGANHRHFHAKDGSGYHFLAEQIALLDPMNPQVASRLARCFDRWKKFDQARQQHARAALEKLHAINGLSNDVFEVVDKALGARGK